MLLVRAGLAGQHVVVHAVLDVALGGGPPNRSDRVVHKLVLELLEILLVVLVADERLGVHFKRLDV